MYNINLYIYIYFFEKHTLYILKQINTIIIYFPQRSHPSEFLNVTMISPTNASQLSQNIKIVLAGSHNVGKTMILWKWNDDDGVPFEEKPTIGYFFAFF